MAYPTGSKNPTLSNIGIITLPTASPQDARAAAPQLSNRAIKADKVWSPTLPDSMIDFFHSPIGSPAAGQRTIRQCEAITASSPTSGPARSSTTTSAPTSGGKTNIGRHTNKRQWPELGSASAAAPAKRVRLDTSGKQSLVASQPSLTNRSVNSSRGPAIPNIGIAMASLANSQMALASTEKNPQPAQASRHTAPLPDFQKFQIELSADNVFRDVLLNFKSTGEIIMENIDSLINFSNTDYPLKHSRLINLIEFFDALLSEMSAGNAPWTMIYFDALTKTVFDRFFSFTRKTGTSESKEPIRMESVKRFVRLLHHHRMLLDVFEVHIKEPKNRKLTTDCGITISVSILQKLRELNLRVSDTELDQMISLKPDSHGIPMEAWRMILAKNHRDPPPQTEELQPGFMGAINVSKISAERLRALNIRIHDPEQNQMTSVQSTGRSNPMEARKPSLDKTHRGPLIRSQKVRPELPGIISANIAFETPYHQKRMGPAHSRPQDERHHSSIRPDETVIIKDDPSGSDMIDAWLSTPAPAIRSTEKYETWNDQESSFPEAIADQTVAAGAAVTTMKDNLTRSEPETGATTYALQTPDTQNFDVDAFWND